MDFFSHALLPYLLGSYLGLKRKYLTALVLGGIAPDLDTLIVWINQIYPTSFLMVHRGFTHTFFFGFFIAATLLFLVSRDSIKSRSRGIISPDLELSPGCLAYAYAGIISHLFLDSLTSVGVPLFYPFTATRYSAEIFAQIEFSILVATLLVIGKLFRDSRANRTDTDRTDTDGISAKIDKRLIAGLLVFLLIVGGIRIGGKAMAEDLYEDGSEIYPHPNLFQWTALKDDNDNKTILISQFNLIKGELPHNSSIPRQNITAPREGFEKALEAAESHPEVKLFRWRAYAVAINASMEDGEWLIEYIDPVASLHFSGTGETTGSEAGNGFRSRLRSISVSVKDGKVRVI